MKFTLGFITGASVVWAALAIWQRVPAFPDIDEMDDPDRITILAEAGGQR